MMKMRTAFGMMLSAITAKALSEAHAEHVAWMQSQERQTQRVQQALRDRRPLIKLEVRA